MSIIFKTFRTYAHPYVYDRHTNAVVMLTDDEYKELVEVEKGTLAADDSAVVRRYQEQGLFQPNVVQKIEHSGTNRLGYYINTRMQQLTLQVTQQCNLRCEYCAYSGIYENNRTHSSKRMSFETAKAAIDLFLSHNNSLSEVVIGFYGGEPLLEFKLIKECVNYAKQKVEGKRLRFNMTTNGTLLSDDVVDFLAENEFLLSVSLDGSKEEHDINRKFLDGRGSFDVVVENVKRLCNRYPDFGRNLQIMTTINPHMDLGCVLEYFSAEEAFSHKDILFNTMSERGLENRLIYDKHFYRVRNYEYIKMLFSMVGRIDKKYVSTLFLRSRTMLSQFRERTRSHSALQWISHHNGPCMPGVKKLFIRTDGKIFPCERVNENKDYNCIGNLGVGIDVERAKKVLNVGKISENLCKKCWALRHCSICIAQIDFDDEPTMKNKHHNCEMMKDQTLFALKELCILNEFGMEKEAGML